MTNPFADLDESEFLADSARARNSTPAEPALRVVTQAEAAQAATGESYIEICSKCRGSGRFLRSYSGGACFACKGEGKFVRKTSPEVRAKARGRAFQNRISQGQRAAEARTAWIEANPDAYGWMTARAARGFGFAQSTVEALAKYGHLTEGQLATVTRLAAQDAERDAARASERAAIQAAAPAVSIEKIAESFAAATAAGLKRPRLRLDDFVFSLAPATGKNAGAIYVKTGEDYLGKVVDGRFVRVSSCYPEVSARVLAVASDPKAAATAYGQRTGSCSCCGRELTNKESIDLGIGPICAGKFGW